MSPGYDQAGPQGPRYVSNLAGNQLVSQQLARRKRQRDLGQCCTGGDLCPCCEGEAEARKAEREES